jgi:3',5'-cyclic AMP phosphodiesterase CpdA
MPLTVAALTDLHFGPRAMFRGKLRKMSDLAPALAAAFVRRMNEHVRPDLVLVLGDLVEDESLEKDQERYAECLRVLAGLEAPVRHVAGNHDTIHMTEAMLRRAWGRRGPLHYSFDHGGVHVVVLHTRERRDLDVTVGSEQIAWLRADLEATSLPVVVAMHHAAAEQDLRGNRWFEHAPHVALVKERAELRRALAASGRVRVVLNGHLHWSHVGVHDGIPYVTVQSLVENVEDDLPGRPAAAHAVVRVSDESVCVDFEGEARMRIECRRA